MMNFLVVGVITKPLPIWRNYVDEERATATCAYSSVCKYVDILAVGVITNPLVYPALE